MIPNQTPGNMRDPGLQRLVDELREVKERLRRLESRELTYGVNGTITSWVSMSPTCTVTDVNGNVRTGVVFCPPYPIYSPTVADKVVILDGPGWTLAVRTSA